MSENPADTVAPRLADASRTISRIRLKVDLAYEVGAPGADFVFKIHAARTPCQRLGDESLRINQPVALQMHTDEPTANRMMRFGAEPGLLTVSYAVTVDLDHHRADPSRLDEVPVRQLPPDTMIYVYPSRYCQSDRMMKFANAEFGAIAHGYRRVQAIRDWVFHHVEFRSGSSDGNTSAIDTLIERVGVCRDFAHLMIGLCRALNIPARFTTGTDYGADPALGPPDFHAYVEAYVGGRWYLFDPSGTAIPMGFVRFGTGRDAADVAFATIFGPVRSQAPVIRATAIDDAGQGFVLPRHVDDALSTDAAD